MSVYRFATLNNLNYSQLRAFRVWLADLKNNYLPLKEWEELWREFNG